MPQLDLVTFFSQFFWLCVFFFGFYFVISKDFLPKMARILKFRKKKKNISSEGMQNMEQENEKVRASCKTVVENGLHLSNNLLLSHLQRVESWLGNVITNTNQKQLQNTNQIYVKWVGDNAIRQQIALQAATFFPTPLQFVFILIEKCKSKRRDSKQNAGAPILLHSRPDSLEHPLSEKTKRDSSSAGQTVKSAKRRSL